MLHSTDTVFARLHQDVENLTSEIARMSDEEAAKLVEQLKRDGITLQGDRHGQ